MSEPWGRERVFALVPDPASSRAAQSLATRGSWSAAGWAGQLGPEGSVWGECQGSAAAPYRVVVDLSGPACRCSCPSRKVPCKHALGLLLRWADGTVAAQPPPGWVTEWIARRDQGTAARAARRDTGQPSEPTDPAAARRRAQQREARVAAGLVELDRWLCDQVRQGLAETQRAGYLSWDSMAAQLVDAQAPGAATLVRGLATVPRSGVGWVDRLLEEYALLRLLTVAYRGQDELPGRLRETVRSRIGFAVRQADVLAGPDRLTDEWVVLGQRELEQDGLRARRIWLRGGRGSRPALLLSFAVGGRAPDCPLAPGTSAEAELAFYPAALPLRAAIVTRQPEVPAGPPPGDTVAAFLGQWADALARDPWLDAWPAVLAGVVPARADGWALADAAGDALPVHPQAGDCWPLIALSGGHPVTVAGEWTPRGFWPLTAWDVRGEVVPL
jgi:hypothetical protein